MICYLVQYVTKDGLFDHGLLQPHQKLFIEFMEDPGERKTWQVVDELNEKERELREATAPIEDTPI